MFNLLQSASDDQTAIGACVLTLIGASFLVIASFHLGPAGQKLRNRDRKNLELTSQSKSTGSAERPQERAA